MYVDTWRGLSLVLMAMSSATCGCSHDSSSHPPFYSAGSSGDAGTTGYGMTIDPCAKPGKAGCPCTEAGSVVECGQLESVSGDYITCNMGYATCNGSVWGACTGNTVVARSVVGHALTPYGKRTLEVSSNCENPCDPYCTEVSGFTGDVGADGLTVTDAGVSITETMGTGGPSSGPCSGLWCQVAACSGFPKTSISGKAYDPAGKNPLYNAYVYIPVDPTKALPALTDGATCDTCAGAAAVSAIAVAQTGPDGSFVLNNVPAGAGVPLVVQMGKWRRKVTLPQLTACADNPVASNNSRLPRNRFDGDGNKADIPRMALASGSADPFECLLLKAGIDADEIQIPGKVSGARIDYYRYNGKDRYPGGAPTGVTLTGSVDTLKKYDVVLLPCEGAENNHNTQAPNLVSYTAAGGRLFTTHYGYVWLATPAPPGVDSNLTDFYGTAIWDIGRFDYNDPTAASIDQSFPKGIAFAKWLQNVSATTTLGSMSVAEPRHNAISAVSGKSQRWVYGASKVAAAGTADMLLAMAFNTPVSVAEENQCGRVVFSDFHVSADALVSTSGCTTNSDCGTGATCNPAVAGVCGDASCRTNTDCSSGLACTGAKSGTCSSVSCKNNWDCGGAKCSSGKCPINSCNASSDCGLRGVCTGGALGKCQRTCTSNSGCSTGYSCVSGHCQKSCFANSECPTFSCLNATSSSCSSSSDMFPLSCRNGDLSGQEKALEFMLFDLAACVSPDSWTPPTPSTQYNAATFHLDFASCCPTGMLPVWRELQWQAQIPNTANITFTVATAADASSLGTATLVPLAQSFVDTTLPNWDGAFIDTTAGSAFFDASPQLASQKSLRIAVTLNPTTDLKASPVLSTWQVLYDCQDGT
jgi:hypothetical protein